MLFMMGFLELILGGIARLPGTASRAAVNGEAAGGGINGGDPRFAVRQPFMPPKPAAS
jgi:hypothetical protein